MIGLPYLGTGRRDYGGSPLLPHRRSMWELEAVVFGRCTPLLPGQGDPVLYGSSLWIFAPQLAHGWTGERGRPCRVVVCHLPTVPEPIRSLVLATGFARLALNPGECRQIEAIGERLRLAQAQPTSHSQLAIDYAIAELLTIAGRIAPTRRLIPDASRPRHQAERAVAWLAEHLADGSGIAEAAVALAISPAHLRRQFHRGLGVNPRTAIHDLRLTRAGELLADPQRTVASVAAACGFTSAAALTRAFVRRHGLPPHRWRKRRAENHQP